MALPATDSFTGNENPLAGNWTTIPDAGNLRKEGGMVQSATDGAGAAYWNADAFNNDQYSKAILLSIAKTPYDGVAVRGSAVANTFYWFYWKYDVSRVYKTVAGVETQIGSDFSTVPADNTVIKIQVVGTTIKIFYATTEKYSNDDSTIASGSAGIRVVGRSSGWDDWEGGNVGAGGVSISISEVLAFAETLD